MLLLSTSDMIVLILKNNSDIARMALQIFENISEKRVDNECHMYNHSQD